MPQRVDRAARLLREAQVGVSAIGSPVGKAPLEGDFEAEPVRFRVTLDAAERLGTRRIRVFFFYIPDGRYSEFRGEVLRRMSALAREAEAQGVVLALENESYVYGDDARRCRDLVESVDSPALEIAFDPANFVQVGVRPFDEAWPQLREHVQHFHVKDAVSVDHEGFAPYPARIPEERLLDSVRPAGEARGNFASSCASSRSGTTGAIS